MMLSSHAQAKMEVRRAATSAVLLQHTRRESRPRLRPPSGTLGVTISSVERTSVAALRATARDLSLLKAAARLLLLPVPLPPLLHALAALPRLPAAAARTRTRTKVDAAIFVTKPKRSSTGPRLPSA